MLLPKTFIKITFKMINHVISLNLYGSRPSCENSIYWKFIFRSSSLSIFIQSFFMTRMRVEGVYRSRFFLFICSINFCKRNKDLENLNIFRFGLNFNYFTQNLLKSHQRCHLWQSLCALAMSTPELRVKLSIPKCLYHKCS